MSLFFRPRDRPASARAIAWPPPGFFDVGTAGAYANVRVDSMEGSLQSIAVRSAVDLLASVTSELPVQVFTGKGSAKRELPVPGWLEDPAGDGHGREDWLYQLIQNWALRGNNVGDVLRRGPGGFLQQVDLQHPDRVRAQIVEGRPEWWFNGRKVDNDEDVFHRRVNPISGNLLGLSVIAQHAQDMGLSLTLTSFGLDYFQHGAHPGAVITNTEKSIESEAVAKNIKRRFMEAMRGREPAVFGRGYKYETVPVNPEESQFLESRGFTQAECARIFGPGVAELLGYTQSGSSLTYANVIDRSLQLLVYSLGKWIRRADRVLTEFLPRPQTARLDRDAILETTTLQRYQAHAAALGNAPWKTPNEVRADEDLSPIEGGDALPSKPAAPAPTNGGSSE